MNEYKEDKTPFGVLTLQSRRIYAESNEPYDRDMFFPSSTTIVDTPYGTIRNGKSVVLFKNLNFLEIVGQELYDEYDLFSLELCQFSSIPFTGSSGSLTTGAPFDTHVASGASRRGFSLFAHGLNWVNSSYSTLTNNDRTYAHVTCLSEYVDRTSPFNVWNNGDAGLIHGHLNFVNRCVFTKPKKMFSLQLSIAPLSLDFEEVPANSGFLNFQSKLVWDFIVQFRIIPIRKSEKFAA